MRDASEGSAVLKPSPPGLDEQVAEQVAEDDVRSADMTGGLAEEDAATYAGGGEVTDTGYKADDDTLELSEAHLASVSDFDSPSVSKAERRLQDSASIHDERDRQRYRSNSWATKFSQAKRSEEQHKTDHHAPGNRIVV